MVFDLRFKTPDVLDFIDEICSSEEERENAKEFARDYLEYSEYIIIRFDDVKKTVVVIKPK